MAPSGKDHSSGNSRIRAACTAFSFVWSLLVILLIFLFPAFFDKVNYKIYDWKLSLRPVGSLSPELVHLDIDDRAIQDFGQWPWDRAISARILDKLSEFHAKLAVFDIFYASPGKSAEGDSAFLEAVKQAGNVVSPVVVDLSDSYKDKLSVEGDRARADAVHDASWSMRIPSVLSLLKVKEIRSSLLPLLPIIRYSKGIGHITATPDADGIFRRVALLVRLEDRFIPSLSFAALLASWNLTPEAITLTGNKEVRIKRGVDELTIPVDSRGMMLINWGPEDGFRHYSVSDLLSDAPDPARPSRYKDKIVMIALSTTGSTDVWKTPLSTEIPGNRIQSFAMNTMLTRSFLQHVPVFPWMALFFAVLAIAFSVVTLRLSLKAQAGLMVLVMIICVSVEILFFVLWATDLPLSGMLAVFLPALFGSVVIRAASMERQAATSRRALERYVPPELLDESLHNLRGPDLTARRLEATIVFVDMQGFSTLSESLDVEYITRFLKDFFEGMSRSIVTQRGRIHQFLGDGFLAVFGDLVAVDDHAVAAVRAAMEMQREMNNLNARWSNSGIRELENGLNIRIGINTGVVFVGDLGSDRRLEYAVVGSAVNIASRLQSLAPPGGIMMTARTKALLRDTSLCTGPQNVRLKGIDKEMEVYTIEKVV